MKIARPTLILSLLFAIAATASAQDFDFKTLDKLGAKAKSATNVTLNSDTLKLASAFLGSDGDKDGDALKSLVANLKGVYVRDYEYEKPGQYDESVLEPLRAWLKQPKWTNIVDVKENGESTQVYYQLLANGKLGGLAVVSSEPKEVAVIFVDGEMNPADMAKLGGNLGIPDIGKLTDAAAKATKASSKAADNKSKTGK
jgi:hypothetical protein